MEIFNMVRGHFALLINKPFKTPAQGKEFTIAKVSTKEGDWQIVLKISTGNYAKVYISDISIPSPIMVMKPAVLPGEYGLKRPL